MNKAENQSEIVLYTTIDGKIKIDTTFKDETIWLTQKKMAELFDVGRPAITKHLKNIFESGELDEKVVSSILEHTTNHGIISKMETVQQKGNRSVTRYLQININQLSDKLPQK